jgi:hypothetical protein
LNTANVTVVALSPDYTVAGAGVLAFVAHIIDVIYNDKWVSSLKYVNFAHSDLEALCDQTAWIATTIAKCKDSYTINSSPHRI